MQKSSRSRMAALNACALAAALIACLVVVVFSWPDRHDRKRAIFPKLAGCCEIRIANMVLFGRKARTAPEKGDPESQPAVVAEGGPGL